MLAFYECLLFCIKGFQFLAEKNNSVHMDFNYNCVKSGVTKQGRQVFRIYYLMLKCLRLDPRSLYLDSNFLKDFTN